MWVPGIELRLLGLHGNCLYLLSLHQSYLFIVYNNSDVKLALAYYLIGYAVFIFCIDHKKILICSFLVVFFSS